MSPPEGRNASRAWRMLCNACGSIGEELESEVPARGTAKGVFAESSWKKDDSAETAAVVRCWLGVRRQALRTAMTLSISAI